MNRDLLLMVKFLRESFQKIWKVEGKVEVNFPAVQKVEVVNPTERVEEVAVTNFPEQKDYTGLLSDLQTKLDKAISGVVKELKKQPTDTTPKLLKKLDELKKAFDSKEDPEKLSPFIKDLQTTLKDKNVDIKPILSGINDIVDRLESFKDFTKYDEVKTRINEKQLEKLVNALSVTVSTSGGSVSGLATEATLASIKDTDGIKKITDALPAGTNKIGTVGFSQTATTATLSNVSGSASSVTIIAANSNRLGLHIVNDSTAKLYLKYGSTASATSYTILLFPYMQFEMTLTVYTGIITGIWSSATGAARVTEITA